MNKRITDSYYINQYTQWTYKGQHIPSYISKNGV